MPTETSPPGWLSNSSVISYNTAGDYETNVCSYTSDYSFDGPCTNSYACVDQDYLDCVACENDYDDCVDRYGHGHSNCDDSCGYCEDRTSSYCAIQNVYRTMITKFYEPS